MAKRKRKPGRPSIPDDVRRRVVLSVRLTESERELIAKAAGPYPPSIWARVELVKVAEKDVKKPRR